MDVSRQTLYRRLDEFNILTAGSPMNVTRMSFLTLKECLENCRKVSSRSVCLSFDILPHRHHTELVSGAVARYVLPFNHSF